MPSPVSSGVAGSTLVLLGGLVLSAVPAGSTVAALPWRHTTSGHLAGAAALVVGMTLLALAWVALWRRATRGDVTLAAVRRTTVLWCLPLLLAPPVFSRDGWSYAAQGRLTGLGLSPYVWGPGILRGPIVSAVDPRWLATPTPYGPLPLLWGSGATDVVQSPWALVVAHRLLALVGLALLAWALPRLAAWTGRDPVLVSALVLPCPLVLAHGVAGLHNDLLVVGLAAASLVLAAERGWLVGAVVVGLAAAVKLPGGLACVGVALLTLPAVAPTTVRVRRLAAVGGVAVATVVAAGVATGVGVGWVHALGVPGSVTTPLTLTAHVGAVVPGARQAGELAALVVVAVVALRAPTGSRVAALRGTALILTATVVLGPVVHPWYPLWCLPLLAACHPRGRGLAVLAGALLALGLTAPLAAEVDGSPRTLAVVLVLGSLALLAQRVREALPDARATGPQAATGLDPAMTAG
ncbi:MAG: polyprenol phosphomannose-dependent alpha 1,6 mannosyltransferase MptB [Nocardioides sp.]